MRLLALIPLALGLALSLPAQAEILDIAVGDKSFQGRFSGPLPRVRDSGAQYELGLLSRPDDEPVDLLQVHAGFLLTGDAGARDVNLAAGLGGRLIYIDRDVVDGGVLALGGQFEAKLPQADRVALSGYAFLAPGVTSAGDLDGYREAALDLAYEVIRGGSVYVGGRYIRHKYDQGGSATVDNGAHIGLRLKF
jgi:hypothetical protein